MSLELINRKLFYSIFLCDLWHGVPAISVHSKVVNFGLDCLQFDKKCSVKIYKVIKGYKQNYINNLQIYVKT